MNLNIYTCPSCPEDCDSFVMPSVNFADCVDSVTEEESEISELFLDTPVDDGSGNITAANGPGDWTSASSWASAIQQSGSGVRHLIGIGDKGPGEQSERTISRGRTKYGSKTFTVNFSIDDVTTENYELIRSLECGIDVIFWYQTKGGYLYGGTEGIKGTAKADWDLQRGDGTYANGVITITWKAGCNPQRIVSPIAISV